MNDEELNEKYGDFESLPSIARELDIPVKRLQRWAEPNRRIGFPAPKTSLGRYLLYDKTEVKEWYFLWQKVSKNLGNDNLPPGGGKKVRKGRK